MGAFSPDLGQNECMTSNIEPFARSICERICLESGMRDADIPEWVDRHWSAAAAEIEVGNIDHDGKRAAGSNWQAGLVAYRERIKSE
jgi:hypothetical protein